MHRILEDIFAYKEVAMRKYFTDKFGSSKSNAITLQVSGRNRAVLCGDRIYGIAFQNSEGQKFLYMLHQIFRRKSGRFIWKNIILKVGDVNFVTSGVIKRFLNKILILGIQQISIIIIGSGSPISVFICHR
ncbi:hypothetical protein DXA98_00610 [Lachnospiraceae bacterium OF09-6]|nr:hypothetical protein DXA98_00610 [Lachnospiraceae bacterium OF09-6]